MEGNLYSIYFIIYNFEFQYELPMGVCLVLNTIDTNQ